MNEPDMLGVLEVKIARLEEKLVAAATAVELARNALTAYQSDGDRWRQLMNDQRADFVTVDRAIAFVTVGIALSVLVARFIK